MVDARTHGRRTKVDLTSGSLLWHLLRMAIPVAAGMMLRSLYSLVDTLWLGKLGDEAVVAVSATGVSRPVLFMSIALGFGLGAGGTALVSQYTGAGQHRTADRAAGQAILLLTGMGLLATAVVGVLAPWIFALMRVPLDVAPSATAYLRIFMLGLPFMAFSMAYGSVLRALGDTITVVLIGVGTNVLNVLLDPMLIFGFGGLPALGVRGAALASAVSQAAGALGCLFWMTRGRAGLHVTRADFAPDWPLIRKIVAVAVPASISSGVNSFGFTVFQTIVNSFGKTVVGAFTIGFQVLHFFNAPMHAMSSATAPIVGQALGAGKVPLARRAVRLSIGILATVLLAPAVVLMFKGQWVASLFIPDEGVIAESGRFFRVVPASSYFFGAIMVLMSAFYGSGHTRPALAVALVRMCVRISTALYLAFVLGMGSTGAYAGMVIGNVTCAVLALYLFLKGGWESAVVIDTPAGSGPDGEAEQTPGRRSAGG